MEQKEKIQQIKELLNDSGVSDFEKLEELKQILPPREVVIETRGITSPKKLEYMKRYNETKRKYAALLKKHNSKELIREKRIIKALERTSYFCFKCKESIKANPENNTYKFERKRGYLDLKLIISNLCPICDKEVRAFGGRFEYFPQK